MRYFTTSQIRAALLLCVLAAAGWSLRYYMAASQRRAPMPFAPWSGDSAALAEVDSLRAYLDSPVNVNTASVEELQRLEGIGPGLAQRIIDERLSRGPFTDIRQLIARVRGIGPVTAAALEGQAQFAMPDSILRESTP